MEKGFIWKHGIGFLLALLIGPTAWLALDSRPPVLIKQQWIEGDLRPGGKFTIAWQAKVLQPNCEGIVRRRIISIESGVVFEYAAVMSVIYDDGRKERIFRRELELPRSIAAGKALHDVTVYYQCNWVQRFFNLYNRQPREPIVFDVGE